MQNLEEYIRRLIDDYCYKNHFDEPENDDQYIQYAKRMQQVAILSIEELNEFVSLINDRQLQSQ